MELHYIYLSPKDITVTVLYVDYIGCQSKHLPGKLPMDDKDAAEIHNEYYNEHLSIIVNY